MKGKYFFLALLLISGNAWAQLTCTNCIVGTASTTTATPTITIRSSPGTFIGDIELIGNSEFEITGTGNYVINGVISETSGHGFGVTYKAPNAGTTGHEAGITLTGGANTYSGLTTIAGGYLICNKPNGRAVPGSIKISAASALIKAHLWCRRNNQLGNEPIIDFNGAQSDSYIHLNGTTQTISGIQANNVYAVVENNEGNSFLPIGMTNEQLSASPATLNIVAGTTVCIFDRGSIRKGSDDSPPLTIKITRGTQIIQNPDNSIKQVTFETFAAAQQGGAPSTLQFDHSDANTSSLIEFITFKGAGIIKKTGIRTMVFTNSTVLQSAGEIRVSDGILQNGDNNNYANGDQKNKATLRISAPDASNNNNPAFDLYGNSSVFDGLTGGGFVQNSRYSTSQEGGYSRLTVGQNNSLKDNSQNDPLFSGIIRDNSFSGSSAEIIAGGPGGIALRKVGTGTQVLTGRNLYTGRTTVSSGTLKLHVNGVLGAANTGDASYGGVLEISNVLEGTAPAIFEHNGTQTQVFTGDITAGDIINIASGTYGKYLQSGTGKTIINGSATKSFSGNVNITAGFLGGSGDLSNANAVTVGASGGIGGFYDAGSNSATLIVSNLTFANASSKLVVTPTSLANGTPSLVDVRTKGTSISGSGSITAADNNRFTVDVLGGTNLVNGYILKCNNGIVRPFPTLGINSTGKPVSFRWDAMGLYMEIGGLTCDNCTFVKNGVNVEGTLESPAVILGSPGTFEGLITLNGSCNFTITGTGNYTLSGRITSTTTSPLTYNAPNANQNGFNTGITLSGDLSNDYTGLTTITGGYVVCNKDAMRIAVPGNLKISATDIRAHLWCQRDSQLVAGATIDFSDAGADSFIHLNGTTQTVAGLIANNNKAVVKKNYGRNNNRFPTGILEGQISKKAGVLNIAAGNPYVFGGGGSIWTGEEIWTGEGVAPNERLLTVNIKSGTQVIEDPGTDINNLILTSVVEGTTPSQATLELSTSDSETYLLGANITLEGGGIIKKTGEGCVAMSSNTTVTKSGLIWVSGGSLQNSTNTRYATNSTTINRATLQVGAPDVGNNNNPVFDLYGSASIFDGLTGGGLVQNSWISTEGTPSGGAYSLLTLGQNNSLGNPIFYGIIQDNATSGSSNYVQAGLGGYSGVALRKVGTGTQVLRGRNRYTGSTSVSSGTLKLQGDGQLGGASSSPADINTYGGVLEISNVTIADGIAPAIFEHSGTRTQIFTGNITNTSTGTLGTYLQSGSGKTIIEGGTTKSFTGNVNIIAGFLGGSGDLRNANSVTVGGGGSIGGGYDEAARGGTLIVANLIFAAAASKLIVTSTSGTNTPSLVEVMGSMTAASRFTVDIVAGTNLVSGYILKCTNGVSGNRPLPTLGTINNTGKKVCFRWDAIGLWMQLSFGNITLSSNSVCPKIGNSGNPDNPDITITATYGDSRDFAGIGDFLFSNNSVKSGAIVPIRVNDITVTATFAGVNATDANRLYTLTYNDHQNCSVMLETRINSQIALNIISGGNPYCKGTPIVLQAAGNAPLAIASTNTDIVSVANNTPSVGTATATTSHAGDVNFQVTDGSGCISRYFPVSVKDIPVMEDVVPENLLTLSLCREQYQPFIRLRSNGTGVTKADAYKWERQGGNNIYDVGLADYNPAPDPPTKTAIDAFTAQNTETTTQRRDVRVTPYNSQTGCYGNSKYFTIQVTPALASVIAPENARICANTGGDTSNSVELEANNAPATTNPWTIVSGSGYGSIADGNLMDKKANVSALDTASQTEEKTVTVQFTSIHGCQARATITISPKTRLDYMRASNLCQYNNGLNENVSIEVQYSNSHGYVLNEITGSWKLINTANPAITVNSAPPTSKATSNKNIVATFPGVAGTSPQVRYVDSRTGCAADKSVMITIESLTAPGVTTPVPLCQNSQASPLAVNDLPGTYNPQGTYNYKWWSPGAQPDTNAPTPLTTLVGEVEYKVSKVKTYSGAAASADGTDPLGYSCTGPQATIKVMVAPSVSISPQLSTDLTKLCSGTTIDNFILTNPSSGTAQWQWLINDQGTMTNTIGTIVTTNAAGNGVLKAGIIVDSDNSVVQDIRLKLGDCPSNVVRVTINPKPTVNISNLNLCANARQAEITPGGLRGATGYKWEQSGSDRGEVGITNNMAGWLPSIPAFTTPGTDAVLMRSMSITPYNSNTTCIGESRVWNITVNPNPTVDAPADREHCSGVVVDATALTDTQGPNTFTWTGGEAAGLKDGSGTGLPRYTASPTATTIGPLKVAISATNSRGCRGYDTLRITVNPKPSIQLSSDVQNLCTGPTIETAAQTNITVSPAKTKYKWRAALVDFVPNGRSVVNIVNESKALGFPTEEFVEEGDFIRKIIASDGSKAQITLYLTPLLGSCAGNPVHTAFRVNGANLLTDISNESPGICSGETTDIKIGSEGDGNTYTWEEINNSGYVLGFTPLELSSRATTIRDALRVTNKRGSTTYYITTRSRITDKNGDYDCTGASVSHTVVVNPTPVLTLPLTAASVCSDKKTAIACSSNLKRPESNNVRYTWEVTSNTLGAQSASGLQDDMPKQLLTNGSDSEESVTYSIIPWYKSEVGKNCAGQPGTFTYRVAPRISATISSSTSEAVCLGDKITLKANKKANSKVTYQWIKGRDKQPIPGATEDSYDVPTDKESESSYAVIITTDNCGSITPESKIVQVSADAYFTGGSASIDKTAASMGEAVKFSYTGPKANHLWNFNDNRATDIPNTGSVTTYSYINPGTYYPTLKVTKPNQEACTKTFLLPSLEIRNVDPNTGYDVFPVPARDKLIVNSSNDLQIITLYDISGKMVISEAVKGRSVVLSVVHMARGIYLLVITDSQGVKHVKISKE